MEYLFVRPYITCLQVSEFSGSCFLKDVCNCGIQEASTNVRFSHSCHHMHRANMSCLPKLIFLNHKSFFLVRSSHACHHMDWENMSCFLVTCFSTMDGNRNSPHHQVFYSWGIIYYVSLNICWFYKAIWIEQVLLSKHFPCNHGWCEKSTTETLYC